MLILLQELLISSSKNVDVDSPAGTIDSHSVNVDSPGGTADSLPVNVNPSGIVDSLADVDSPAGNNYTKSLHIYLQQMHDLENVHPEIYQHFQDGLHVIKMSDRFWAVIL